MSIKSAIEEYKESRREKKAFSKIVNKRALQVRREAYEQEALKQAKIQGARLAEREANKPTLGQRFVTFAQGIAPPPIRVAPVRRIATKRAVRRRTRRLAPIRKRRVTRRRTAKRRVVRYAPVRRRRITRVVPRKRRVKRTKVVKEQSGYSMAPTMDWGF